LKLRKQSIKNLREEYLGCAKETEACKRAFEQTSVTEIDTREKIAKQYIQSFVRENLIKTDILSKISPSTAKLLKLKLTHWQEMTLASLSYNYLSDQKIMSISERERGNFIREMRGNSIKIVVDFMGIQQQFIDLPFNAAFEAVKHSGGKPSLESDEYLSNLLSKHFPNYSKYYQGAWKAFESDNPDRFRHCSASLRELIRNILGDDKEARQTKLREFSNSETENDLIESLATAIYANDRILNKGVHSELEERIVALSIKTTEIILQYVLEKKELQMTNGV